MKQIRSFMNQLECHLATCKETFDPTLIFIIEGRNEALNADRFEHKENPS